MFNLIKIYLRNKKNNFTIFKLIKIINIIILEIKLYHLLKQII